MEQAIQRAISLSIHSVEQMYNYFWARLPNLVVGLLTLVIFNFVSKILKKFVVEIGEKAHLDNTLIAALGTITTVAVNLLGILVAATIVFPSFSPANLVAGLGISSVAIGFAFKDILENFFAGILILWQKPFRIGDEIRSGAFEGTVQSIDIRSTRIKTIDEEMVVVPNGSMLSSPIVVLTGYAHRRVKMDVPLGTSESVEKIRGNIIDALSKIPEISKDPAPVVFQPTLDSTNTTLQVWFWADSKYVSLQQATAKATAAIQSIVRTKPSVSESSETAVVPQSASNTNVANATLTPGATSGSNSPQ